MILNFFELQLTQEKIYSLQEVLQQIPLGDTDEEKFLLNLEKDAVTALVEDLKKSISTYNQIIHDYKNLDVPIGEVFQNPEKLLYMRVANNVSQESIAQLLSMTIEEVKRQEDQLYENLNPEQITKIYTYIKEVVRQADSLDWNLFPIREIQQRKWVDFTGIDDSLHLIKEWFITAFGSSGYEMALHRKSTFKERLANNYGLLAWQAAVLNKAKRICSQEYPAVFEMNDKSWVSELVKLSMLDNGPIAAQKFLLTKGIVLIIEEHLPQTYLDGAVMFIPNSKIPVIGMTLRHDRLDNFWFVLLHELGHIFLHLNNDRLCIIDEDVDGETSENTIEREADEFALSGLISPSNWESCMSRFIHDDLVLEQESQQFNIHPSILAGRIRKEEKDYRLFNKFVGHAKVRVLFEEINSDS